jgi:hypothetical protein
VRWLLVLIGLVAACSTRAEDWYPMDTAPRDGTIIRIRCNSGADAFEETVSWRTIDYSEYIEGLLKTGKFTREELGDPISTGFHPLDGKGTLWGGPLPNCRWHLQ